MSMRPAPGGPSERPPCVEFSDSYRRGGWPNPSIDSAHASPYGGQTMTRTRALPLLAAGAALVPSALAGAGCGSARGAWTASWGPPKGTAPPPTLDVSTNRLGEVLVDS